MTRQRRSAAALVIAALVAASCGSNADEDAAEESTTTVAAESAASTEPVESVETTSTTTAAVAETTSTAPPPLVESVEWESCPTNADFECGVVTVPADYRDQGAGTLEIAINRLSAADTDRRRGVLLVNPGGPGAPGTDFAEGFQFGFPQELLDNFDIIGFDPRGVGKSEPAFGCGESGDQIEVLSVVEELVDTPEEEEALADAVQLCVDSMGDVAGLIHTGYVARDMDEIRKALGEEQISFLGFSYGSIIGVWYATLFPENVRAMVIDGADNPIDDLSDFEAQLESTREQMGPFHDLLEEALTACADSSCPIYNNGDPVGYYIDASPKFELVDEAMSNPDAGFLGLITPLYNEAAWPGLWDGIAALQEDDDPSIMVDFAEFQLGDDPGAVNITGYINCLDGWALQPEFDRSAREESAVKFFEIEDQLDAEFPLFSVLEDGLASPCSYMDVLDTPVLEGPFDGSDVPILVVGNVSDPATPFGESEEFVTEVLSNGILLKVDHPAHTVYPDNPCVNEVVHAVLFDVDIPTDTVECDRVEPSAQGDLFDVCVAVGPDISLVTLSADELSEACTDFVDKSFDRLGEDVVEAGLYGEDEDAGAALLGILQESLTAAGG